MSYSHPTTATLRQSTPLAVWVVPVSDVGGVARHVIDVTRRGIAGWRLIVVCPPGPLAERLKSQGTAVVIASVSPSDGVLRATVSLRKVLKRLNPSIVHTHLAYADVIGAVAATSLAITRAGRPKVISTEHGIAGIRGLYQSGAVKAWLTAMLHRIRLHRTDHVIAVSHSTQEQVIAQWGRAAPITVIPNGVDGMMPRHDAPRHDRSDSALRVLSLSRLAPEKRIEAVLDAFAIVLAHHPLARLTIAGSGPLEERVRAQATSLGIAQAVEFPGHVDAQETLATHDVVVQLSAWENLSYTLLDARVNGLGIVATDVGGNREIVSRHCLASSVEPQEVARLIMEQACPPASHPEDAPVIHSVADMTSAIAAVYEEVTTP